MRTIKIPTSTCTFCSMEDADKIQISRDVRDARLTFQVSTLSVLQICSSILYLCLNQIRSLSFLSGKNHLFASFSSASLLESGLWRSIISSYLDSVHITNVIDDYAWWPMSRGLRRSHLAEPKKWQVRHRILNLIS